MDPNQQRFQEILGGAGDLWKHSMTDINPKDMLGKVNKNLHPRYSFVRVINIIIGRTLDWSYVILNVKKIAKRFRNFVILLENNKVLVLTSTHERVLQGLEQPSIQNCSRPLHEFEHLSAIYGCKHTFMIYWTDHNICRVTPKCLDSSRIFQYAMQDIVESVSHSVNVMLETVLERENELMTESGYGISMVETKDERKKECKGIGFKRQYGNEMLCFEKLVTLNDRKRVIGPRHETFTPVYPINGGYPIMANDDVDNSQMVFNTGGSSSDNRTNDSDNSPVVVDTGSVSENRANGFLRQETTVQESANLVIGRQTRPPRYPDYVPYQNRLDSYVSWVKRNPTPNQLTEAGFFFTNQGDLVRCHQCGIGLKDFSDEDDPLLEHVRYSGTCDYLLEYLGPTRLSELQSSFRPVGARQNGRIRVEDHVRCFACDGGLRRWDPDDDPWTEHCRWFPTCPYAREVKGDEYIALVQASTDMDMEENPAAGGTDLSQTLAQMTLRDPQYQAVMAENKRACLDMGFQEEDFNDTVQELRNRGTIWPTLEDIVDNIAIVKENKDAVKRVELKKNETPQEENMRLKRMLFCMECHKNKVNALFLPCTHHQLCMECARSMSTCPTCGRKIIEKIKTYLG